jgi:hypothetical protein
MDDDNERNEDDEDEEETAIRSYSKKKHFGKLDKGINRFSFKATYSPKIELLKVPQPPPSPSRSPSTLPDSGSTTRSSSTARKSPPRST